MTEHTSVRRLTYLSGTREPNRESNNLARHATMLAWARDREQRAPAAR